MIIHAHSERIHSRLPHRLAVVEVPNSAHEVVVGGRRAERIWGGKIKAKYRGKDWYNYRLSEAHAHNISREWPAMRVLAFRDCYTLTLNY